MSIEQNSQKLDFGARIELLEIDGSAVGSTTYRITPNARADGAPISFQGMPFVGVNMVTEGWIHDGTGGLPRPTITVADIQGTLMLEVMKHDGLVGVQVKRWITEEAYLDGGSVADGSCYGPEIWSIAKVLEADGTYIKFELAAFIDQRNLKFPGRQMFRKEFPGLALNRPR